MFTNRIVFNNNDIGKTRKGLNSACTVQVNHLLLSIFLFGWTFSWVFQCYFPPTTRPLILYKNHCPVRPLFVVSSNQTTTNFKH